MLTCAELSTIGAKDNTRRKAAQNGPESEKYVNWLKYKELMLSSANMEEAAILKKDLSVIELVGAFQETVREQVQSTVDNIHWKRPKTSNELCEFRLGGISYKFIVNYDGEFVVFGLTSSFQFRRDRISSKTV